MSKIGIVEKSQRIRSGRSARWALGSIIASVVLVVPMLASGTTSVLVKSAHVPGFAGALVSHSSRSLYILSSEKGAKLKCNGACLETWIPLEVKTPGKTNAIGAGVKGKIGYVTRSKTMKQVTFNSYPLYTYQGDSGALQSNGEGITADGGTWTLVKASAASAAATAYTSNTTTTTSGGGYGGY